MPSTHVLHITTVPKSLRFIRGQIPFMRSRGVHLSFATSPAAGDEEREVRRFEQEHGVRVHSVEMPRKISPIADLRALVKLTLLIRRLRPDIVHAHTPKGGLLGMMAATLCNHPARVYHMRGLPMMTATGRKRDLLTMTERISCGCAHRVICVSHSLREVAIEHDLVSSDRIEVMAGGSGQGVDALRRFSPEAYTEEDRRALYEELSIEPGAPVVGFIGRLVRDKGIVELTRAWQTLHRAHPEAWLVCVGDYEERDPVPQEVRELLESLPRTRLVGWREDTPRYYTIMDVLALPTYREGFPNVPLEAAAMEVPVVATRIPGCVDAVEDGVTGKLVAARDAEALTEALDGYLRDAPLRRATGARARARVLDRFLPEQIFAGIHEVYQELLRGK